LWFATPSTYETFIHNTLPVLNRRTEITMKLRTAGLSIIVSIILAVSSTAQQATAPESGNTMATEHQDDGVAMSHDHHMGTSAPVTYAELENTAALLQSARQATEKYRDFRVAEADGYHGMGPDVPGMGIHYVGPYDGSNFDVAHPAILLYEKSTRTKMDSRWSASATYSRHPKVATDNR
jgi:hypothetical protein